MRFSEFLGVGGSVGDQGPLGFNGSFVFSHFPLILRCMILYFMDSSFLGSIFMKCVEIWILRSVMNDHSMCFIDVFNTL